MAGFAVNLQVILSNPRALFKRRGAKPGMQESDFLKQITKVEDLEPKAKNCTQVSGAACIYILCDKYQPYYILYPVFDISLLFFDLWDISLGFASFLHLVLNVIKCIDLMY